MSLVFATTFFFFFFFFFWGGGGGVGVLRHLAVQTDFEFKISGPLVVLCNSEKKKNTGQQFFYEEFIYEISRL